MNERDLDRVAHMLDAARRAVSFLDGRTRKDLDDDEMLALAVTHLLEVLGEAAKGVSGESRQRYPDVPWTQMAATRDRLIHGYFNVDLDIVWEIVRTDLPSVVESLEAIQRAEGDDDAAS